MLHGGLWAKACCCFVLYMFCVLVTTQGLCHALRSAGMKCLALRKTALLATLSSQQTVSLQQLLQESPNGDGIASSGQCHLSAVEHDSC